MSKIDPSQSVKRPGSPIAGGSGSGAEKQSRNLVNIPEDVWLEALKCHSGTKWSKMRLVTRQLNGLVQRNVSRLPMAVIDSAAMRLRNRKENEVKMIVSDSNISPDEQEQWFKDHGITINVLAGIQLDNAIIGTDVNDNSFVDLCALGPAQGEKLTPFEKMRPWFFGQQYKSRVLFYAEFSPRNQSSWSSLAFFLKLLYDPSTFIKNLSMYAVNNKVMDTLFSDEEKRYIRCESFTLQSIVKYRSSKLVPSGLYEASVKDICESVSWLEQNVQADIVQFPDSIRYNDSQFHDAVSNYLLGSSWTSASQVVKLGEMYRPENFLGILIEKLLTIAVQSIFPTVVFSVYKHLSRDSLNKQLSGKSIVREQLEDPEDDSEASVKDTCESVSWLGKNVQADIVQFSDNIRYNDSEICDAMTNYLLCSSWTSANQAVKLGVINNAERFFGVLIEKFPTVAVQSIFPTVVFRGYQPLFYDSLNNQLSGKSGVKVKLVDPKDASDRSYTISNGSTQLRIEFIRLRPSIPYYTIPYNTFASLL